MFFHSLGTQSLSQTNARLKLGVQLMLWLWQIFRDFTVHWSSVCRPLLPNNGIFSRDPEGPILTIANLLRSSGVKFYSIKTYRKANLAKRERPMCIVKEKYDGWQFIVSNLQPNSIERGEFQTSMPLLRQCPSKNFKPTFRKLVRNSESLRLLTITAFTVMS